MIPNSQQSATVKPCQNEPGLVSAILPEPHLDEIDGLILSVAIQSPIGADGQLDQGAIGRIDCEQAYRQGFATGAAEAITAVIDCDWWLDIKPIEKLRHEARQIVSQSQSPSVEQVVEQARSRGRHQGAAIVLQDIEALESAGWHADESPTIAKLFSDWLAIVNRWRDEEVSDSQWYFESPTDPDLSSFLDGHKIKVNRNDERAVLQDAKQTVTTIEHLNWSAEDDFASAEFGAKWWQGVTDSLQKQTTDQLILDELLVKADGQNLLVFAGQKFDIARGKLAIAQTELTKCKARVEESKRRFNELQTKHSQPSLHHIATDAATNEELGFIQKVMKNNLASAPKPQPIFALAGALGLTAAIVGRKVQDEFDGRTNLQILVVGETSSGKDFSRQQNDEILASCGLAAIISAEEVTSDTALYRMLAQYPSRLAQFDEFGRFLQTAMTAKNGWLFNVVSALLKLYSSANRQRFVPKTYADKKHNPDIEINCPHLVLHGTSTPEAIYAGLGSSAEDDGFLGRCLVFESEQQPRKKMRPKELIADSIIAFGEAWGDAGRFNLADVKGAAPQIIHTTKAAMDVFEAFDEFAHNRLLAKSKGSKLWGRAEQKARQVALVVACARLDITDESAVPIVDDFCARWSVALVRAITSHMQKLSVKWLASNALEASHQRMLRIVASSEPEGLTQSELTRKSQWTTRRERVEILQTLIESRLIVSAFESAKGETATDARWHLAAGIEV